MSAPHFRSHPQIAAAFDAHVARGHVDVAVRSALAAGLSVTAADVPLPATTALEATPTPARSAFRETHARALAAERTALALVGAQASVRAEHLRQADLARGVDRAAWVTSRVAELESEHHSRLRAQWLATAEAEAQARFDAAPAPAPEPSEPARPRGRKVA